MLIFVSFRKCFNSLLTPSRHKTRLHIGQLVKDTSAKLKQASEIDHHAEVNVRLFLTTLLVTWRVRKLQRSPLAAILSKWFKYLTFIIWMHCGFGHKIMKWQVTVSSFYHHLSLSDIGSYKLMYWFFFYSLNVHLENGGLFTGILLILQPTVSRMVRKMLSLDCKS